MELQSVSCPSKSGNICVLLSCTTRKKVCTNHKKQSEETSWDNLKPRWSEAKEPVVFVVFFKVLPPFPQTEIDSIKWLRERANCLP